MFRAAASVSLRACWSFRLWFLEQNQPTSTCVISPRLLQNTLAFTASFCVTHRTNASCWGVQVKTCLFFFLTAPSQKQGGNNDWHVSLNVPYLSSFLTAPSPTSLPVLSQSLIFNYIHFNIRVVVAQSWGWGVGGGLRKWSRRQKHHCIQWFLQRTCLNINCQLFCASCPLRQHESAEDCGYTGHAVTSLYLPSKQLWQFQLGIFNSSSSNWMNGGPGQKCDFVRSWS